MCTCNLSSHGQNRITWPPYMHRIWRAKVTLYPRALRKGFFLFCLSFTKRFFISNCACEIILVSGVRFHCIGRLRVAPRASPSWFRVTATRHWSVKPRYPIPPFDFTVQGVTSISVDIHKYGLGPKGTSVVLYRNHEIRKQQFVAVTEWSGGLYISPTVAGSRPGGLIAGAWAAMMTIGEEGYLEAVRKVMEVSKVIQQGIKQIPELFIVGRPDMTVIAFGSDKLDIFKVNDVLSTQGWHLNALQRPNSIHICLTLQHTLIAEDFLKDLKEAVTTVQENPSAFEDGMAPIYGAAGKMPDRGMVRELLIEYMDNTC